MDVARGGRGAEVDADARGTDQAQAKRIELDRDRAARDQRVEQAVAEVLLLLDERDRLTRRLSELPPETGAAPGRLHGQDVTLAQAAELCGLELAEVRRLTRAARASGSSSAAVAADGTTSAPPSRWATRLADGHCAGSSAESGPESGRVWDPPGVVRVPHPTAYAFVASVVASGSPSLRVEPNAASWVR